MVCGGRLMIQMEDLVEAQISAEINRVPAVWSTDYGML